jgi:hypothetical protein
MWWPFLPLCSTLVGVVGSGAAVRADEGDWEIPSPIELQVDCLRYRDQITRHGYVMLHRVIQSSGVAGNERKEVYFRIWFSDERLRFDVGGGLDSGDWREWEHYVVENDRYIFIPEGDLGGVIAPASEYQQQGGVAAHFSLFHPRWLGMGQNSESLLHREPQARTVNPRATKAKYKEVALEPMAGFRTWRVTYETSFPPPKPGDGRNAGECVMWFAPEAGGSLVRAELREFGKRMTMVRSVESHLEQSAKTESGSHARWFEKRSTMGK